MGALRTLAICCAAALPAAAGAGMLPGIVATFATCTGRLSAQMEHEWLMGGHDEAIASQRAAMAELLVSITPAGAGRDALAARIEAKMAHASLLTRATFNRDAEDAAWASARAEAEIAACQGLLL